MTLYTWFLRWEYGNPNIYILLCIKPIFSRPFQLHNPSLEAYAHRSLTKQVNTIKKKKKTFGKIYGKWFCARQFSVL